MSALASLERFGEEDLVFTKALYFLKLSPIFVGSLNDFENKYKEIRFILNQ